RFDTPEPDSLRNARIAPMKLMVPTLIGLSFFVSFLIYPVRSSSAAQRPAPAAALGDLRTGVGPAAARVPAQRTTQRRDRDPHGIRIRVAAVPDHRGCADEHA